MSAKLDLVRSIYADWERGDNFGWAEFADPEIESTFPDGLVPGGSTGVAAQEERMRDFLAAWEDFRVEVEEYRELDDERVLVLLRRTGRGKASGVQLEGARGAELLHIRNERIAKVVWYWDRDRALADLGMEE
jgi:ketosteroid isomerase-like protein